MREAVRDADMAIIVTEWDEIRNGTPSDFKALMKVPVVYDGRRIYDPNQMRAAGIRFGAVGLGP
jgi:UDPglucose 6-dehydrogenase